MSSVTFNINHNKDISRITKAADTGIEAVSTQALKDSNKRTPKDKSILINSSINHSDLKKGLLVWSTPYARYLYYGILMVDPETGSPWAKKHASKVRTERELRYKTGLNALAGKMWAHRAYADNKDLWNKIIQAAFTKDLRGD